MKYDLHEPKKHNNGFTLIELVIVIAVLLVLSAIMFPLISGWVQDAKEGAAINACHSCVHAAKGYLQKVVAEEKDLSQLYMLMSDENIREYGGIDSGTIQVSVTFKDDVDKGKKEYDVEYLTYVDKNGVTVTYVGGSKTDDPFYYIGRGNGWVKGERWEKGDIMYNKGFIFRCLATHTTGSRSNTRDPTVKSNKGSWEVIGYTGEMLPYNSTVRYGPGVQTLYKGNIYARTEYNLTGGQTPYSNSSSRYWLLVSPAPTTP